MVDRTHHYVICERVITWFQKKYGGVEEPLETNVFTALLDSDFNVQFTAHPQDLTAIGVYEISYLYDFEGYPAGP